MTATIIPLHRGGTQDLQPDVVERVHALWEAFENVPTEERDYHRAWLERMFALGESFDEAINVKERRDEAIAHLNPKDPA